MHHLLTQTSHRPYPVPADPWVMSQTWIDLLFAHWSVDPAILQKLLPKPLRLDLFQGQAYIGVVPFRMSDVKPRGLCSVNFLSEFLELNVRTYVTVDERPGVYFFSLDASNFVAVAIARAWYHLPYFQAQMSLESKPEANMDESRHPWIHYASKRHGQTGNAEFKAAYRPISEVKLTKANTVEAFLTERYCLYVIDKKGMLCRGDIHHKPWPLQEAEAKIDKNTMNGEYSFGFSNGLSGEFSGSPLLHFSKRLETLEWQIKRV